MPIDGPGKLSTHDVQGSTGISGGVIICVQINMKDIQMSVNLRLYGEYKIIVRVDWDRVKMSYDLVEPHSPRRWYSLLRSKCLLV